MRYDLTRHDSIELNWTRRDLNLEVWLRVLCLFGFVGFGLIDCLMNEKRGKEGGNGGKGSNEGRNEGGVLP